MEFEWDEDKAAANLAKHGVSFPYATRVFLDPCRLEEEDPEEQNGEVRFRTLGIVEHQVLLVVYTYRDTVIRMISARRATRHEKRNYHEVSTRSGPPAPPEQGPGGPPGCHDRGGGGGCGPGRS